MQYMLKGSYNIKKMWKGDTELLTFKFFTALKFFLLHVQSLKSSQNSVQQSALITAAFYVNKQQPFYRKEKVFKLEAFVAL